MPDHPYKEITSHVVAVYHALSPQWQTNAQLAAKCTGVSRETVKHHTRRLAAEGVVDAHTDAPEHAYRLTAQPSGPAADLVRRLDAFAETFNDQMKGPQS